MEQDFHTRIQAIRITPSDREVFAVWNGVLQRKQRYARIRIILSVLTSVCALVGVVLLGIRMVDAFSASGIGTYIQVFFTEYSVVHVFWKELALSVLEALPVVVVCAFFGVLFVFLASMRKISLEVPRAMRIRTAY